MTADNVRTDKRIELVRLIIFCVLSALPSVAVPFLREHYGEPICTGEAAMSSGVSLFLTIGMLSPSVANILTRLITREGFKDCRLGLNLKKENVKYYVAAFVVKLAEAFAGALLVWGIFLRDVPLSELFNKDFFSMGLPTLLAMLSFALTGIVMFFGEEFGWRGYMMPKLLKLTNKPAALIIGGIIWGLWHAPITIQGHNFGLDYPFFPWLGILLMCLDCTMENCFYTLLSERTKSVFPAVICHGVNNQCGIGVAITVLFSEAALLSFEMPQHFSIILSLIITVPITVVGIASFVLFCKGKQKMDT